LAKSISDPLVLKPVLILPTPPHPNPYQENIKEALNTLIGVNESIYNSIVNISMQGELKEFNDAVPIGETHQLDFEIFKNSSDTNM